MRWLISSDKILKWLVSVICIILIAGCLPNNDTDVVTKTSRPVLELTQPVDFCEQTNVDAEQLSEAYLQLRANVSEHTKLCAIKFIGKGIPSTPLTVEMLATALLSESSITVKHLITDALNSHPDLSIQYSEEAAQSLLKALDDERSQVRGNVLIFLGNNRVFPEMFIPKLGELLWDENLTVQGNSALALQLYTGQTFLDDPDWNMFKLGDGGTPEITLAAREWWNANESSP